MKFKFKIGDIVQYKTQHGYIEPYYVTTRGFLESLIDKQNIYTLQNSSSKHIQVCEDLLTKYEMKVTIPKGAIL